MNQKQRTLCPKLTYQSMKYQRQLDINGVENASKPRFGDICYGGKSKRWNHLLNAYFRIGILTFLY